jgi:hypothetical protein
VFLTERLRSYLVTRRSRPTVTATTSVVSPEYVIMSLAGHRPSGLADAFGGYLCACRQSSWSHLATYGPHGGCAQGWYDAREFLARFTVRDGAE